MRVTDRLRRAVAVRAVRPFVVLIRTADGRQQAGVTLTRAGQERTVTVTLGTLPGT